MNERIKELLPDPYTHVLTTGKLGQVDILEYYKKEHMIKFAELIVQECAGIYSKIDNGNAHLGTEDYLEALQKHFGVV